ncbi:MAG: 50S ribosomal protein L17 [Chlamydiota bacterium]|nr:50S ribosomal protein L17 [Chlamydiota bacterium]
MRHRKLSKRLSRNSSHRKAMVANLVKSLIKVERLETTLAKAKVASRMADRMVTLAKGKTVHAQRRAAQLLSDRGIVKKLFREIGPRFVDRAGGYTRVIRLGTRSGDRASMAILEWVEIVGPVDAEPKEETADKKEPSKKEPAKV